MNRLMRKIHLQRSKHLLRHRFGTRPPATLTSIIIYFILLAFVFLLWHSHNYNSNYVITVISPGANHNRKSNHHLEIIETQHHQGASSLSGELYQLMAKQYDVQHGLYRRRPYKKILYWNSFKTLHDNKEFGMGIGRDGYRLAGCPVWQCETSQDRSNLMQYDAVLFHSRGWDGSDLPATRSPKQRYIFFAKEAPSWDRDSEEPYINTTGFFNWTMTYRWDSDVVHPYGWIEPKLRGRNKLPIHPKVQLVQQLMNKPSPINYAAGNAR